VSDPLRERENLASRTGPEEDGQQSQQFVVFRESPERLSTSAAC
jgi:hypothetical protein